MCKDCESVKAHHHWYNKDSKSSACYHCEVVKEGKHWFIESDKVLAYEYFGSEIGDDYYLKDLQSDKQIEMLFDLCQVLRANITSIGWKHLFEEIGIRKMYEIDCESGWFDTENEKGWIESIYHISLMNGYNPLDGNIGKWEDNSNMFYSEHSKSKIDWNYIQSLNIPMN